LATALNVLGLSVSFAAVLIIMMQVEFDRTFDRSHKDVDRIFRVELKQDNERSAIFSRPMSNVFINASSHIEAGALARSGSRSVFFRVDRNGEKESYEHDALIVSPSFKDVFHFDMVEGSDMSMETPNSVLIPLSLSRKVFGAEAAAGRRLEINNASATVGGVYRDFPRNSSLRNCIYMPMSKDENKDSWENHNYLFYMRVDAATAASGCSGLFEDMKRTIDASVFGDNSSWKTNGLELCFVPLPDVYYSAGVSHDNAPKGSRQKMYLLMCIALVILCIAGINYANFSMALAPKRIRSVNTQKVYGGSATVISFSMLAEAVGICLLSFFIAIGLVYLARDTSLSKLVDAEITPAGANMWITLFTAGIAVATGLATGAYPAWYITSFQPALVLKGSFGLSPKGRALRSVLIGVQFVASFALIICASFMYLQNRYMQNAPLGYERDEVLITHINAKIFERHTAFENRLRSFAGIKDVTFAEQVLSSGDQYMGWGRNYRDRQIYFQCLPVSPSFLDVMGIEVTEGRNFREEDAKTSSGAFIFNEKARRDFDLRLNEKVADIEIIGFMPDIKFASFRTEVSPMAFYVWGTDNWGSIPVATYIKVSAGSDIRAAMNYVKATLLEFDDSYPFFNVRFFDDVLQLTYEKEIAQSSLISFFSLVAILISIVGVFGLVIFDSEYRRKEISIRKAFGSGASNILLMFNRAYLRIVLVCFTLAAPVAYYVITRWLEAFAYKTPLYWWVFLIIFMTVALITAITVTFQNWRAANVNPVESMRVE
jgi:putative ABC transport system permease protein